MELNLNNSYQIFLENSINLSKKITYGFENIESGGIINRVILTIRNFIRWIKKIFYNIYKSIQRKFSLDKSLINKINKNTPIILKEYESSTTTKKSKIDIELQNTKISPMYSKDDFKEIIEEFINICKYMSNEVYNAIDTEINNILEDDSTELAKVLNTLANEYNFYVSSKDEKSKNLTFKFKEKELLKSNMTFNELGYSSIIDVLNTIDFYLKKDSEYENIFKLPQKLNQLQNKLADIVNMLQKDETVSVEIKNGLPNIKKRIEKIITLIKGSLYRLQSRHTSMMTYFLKMLNICDNIIKKYTKNISGNEHYNLIEKSITIKSNSEISEFKKMLNTIDTFLLDKSIEKIYNIEIEKINIEYIDDNIFEDFINNKISYFTLPYKIKNNSSEDCKLELITMLNKIIEKYKFCINISESNELYLTQPIISSSMLFIDKFTLNEIKQYQTYFDLLYNK